MSTWFNDADYERLLASGLLDRGPVAVEPSDSGGWFSRPQANLDPRLVGAGGKLHPNIRSTLLNLLYTFWGSKYHAPEVWSTAWLAGSAVAWQWADRTEPDLDVLVGVDMAQFRSHNPGYGGFSDPTISARFNDEFRKELDPWTEGLFLGQDGTIDRVNDSGDTPFDITFYVNPMAADIRNINPYAAYDLTNDDWTVPPVELPGDWDPNTYYPQEWLAGFAGDLSRTHALVAAVNEARGELERETDSGRLTNVQARLRGLVGEASSLFDEIHLGRKESFAANGGGFFGRGNARWQFGKKSGAVKALSDIRALGKDAGINHPVGDVEELLWRASKSQQLPAPASEPVDWYRKALGE